MEMIREKLLKTERGILKTGDGTEGSLLIPKKIYGTLIDTVKKKLISSETAALDFGPDEIPGQSIDINLADVDSMRIFAIGEGAAVPLGTETYSNINLKPVKYAVRPAITKEMMEDNMFQLLERQVMMAGRKLGENETSLILVDAFDNATNTITGGANMTVENYARLIQHLEDTDHEATDFFCGPEIMYDIRTTDTFLEANKFGNRETLESGTVGRLLGVNVHVFSRNAAPSTTYSKYGYMIDRDHAWVRAEKRTVTVGEYDDVTRDMQGVVISQRLKVRHLRAEAIAKLTTT